ncbi:hypothetical protein F2Q68_00040030 [Brassica cretica]|uniref:Uncharacterized protein n=1 Tax=Brassica cretica TaxID=69181 RepID=A0A8S9MQ39_BRACR|nr:hypothetical protein F2Q68_00040030 [Brassica cretica]
MLSASIGEPTRDLILGVIKSDLHFVWANIIWRMIGLLKVFWITQESYPINFPKCWKQPRGLFKSMDPDSEVKKRERLTKCILKLKDNKLTGVRIESSGSRKPRMLRKSLSLCGPRVEIIRTRDRKSGVLAKDLLDQTRYLGAVTLAKACWILDDGSMIGDDHLSITVLILSVLASMETESFQDVTVCHRVFCPDVCGNQSVAKMKLRKLMGSVMWRLPRAVARAVTRALLDRETVKGSWPRERNCRGKLQAGLGAKRLGWWRNRPSVSLKWDLADQREGHGERTEGNELRERQTDPNRDIRPDGRFKPPLVDASPSCSDATGSDPYTNGSRLGYREMVPESDGLIASVLMMRIRRQELSEAVNGCIVLERDTGGTGSGALSMASVLSVPDGWLETKQSLFVYLGHVGMVG